jgi:4-carboxymuconolactone decarboxylase
MPISEEARKTHEALFPGHDSNLKTADPELIEVFDNFAFHEVPQFGSLDAKTRVMVQLASLIACQSLSAYRVMLGGALDLGVTPAEVKEIVYQAVPYVGMARVFDFLHATNEVLAARGIQLPLQPQSTTAPETREAKGRAIRDLIIGAGATERMYAAAVEDERHFQYLLSANCFGDYLTRTGLDLRTRELLTFAMLVSLGGCEPQARSHASANLNVGNDRAVLLSVITQLLPFIGYPRTLNALAVIKEVT